MGEKYIKKIVRLSITREEWTNNALYGEDNLQFTVKGEIKNTGLSEVKSAVVIAVIIDAKSKKTFQVFTKKLIIFKAADYTLLPAVKPNQSIPFEISVQFPPFKSLLFGKWSVRSLEDNILKGKFRQKLFLIYDTRVLDDETEKWFREELLDNIKLMSLKWDALYSKNKKLLGYKCTGQIKNIGVKHVENFYILAFLENKFGKPIILYQNDEEKRIEGSYIVPKISPHEKIRFEVFCRIPDEELLKENKLSLAAIQEKVEKEEFRIRITTMFVESIESKQRIYRSVTDDPTVIEEEMGVSKIEKIQEVWSFDPVNEEYSVSGIIKNTGERDVEDVYLLASIIDKEKGEPIIWETASDTFKTLVIEKIPYISIDEDIPFAFTIKLPSGKIFSKTKWNVKNIPEGIEQGNLTQNVELYYVKEDISEEGLKRLRFGNSYFQLKNYRRCIQEYLEGIKLIPDEKRLFFNLSLCYYKVEEIQKALEYCLMALKLDLHYEKALYLMGLLNHHIKKYEDALSWYHKALETTPENAKILYNIGCIYMELNNTQKGFDFLRQAYAKDRNRIFSQIVRDADFVKIRGNKEFIDFIQNIQRETVS